jgi:hypothetical protein
MCKLSTECTGNYKKQFFNCCPNQTQTKKGALRAMFHLRQRILRSLRCTHFGLEFRSQSLREKTQGADICNPSGDYNVNSDAADANKLLKGYSREPTVSISERGTPPHTDSIKMVFLVDLLTVFGVQLASTRFYHLLTVGSLLYQLLATVAQIRHKQR